MPEARAKAGSRDTYLEVFRLAYPVVFSSLAATLMGLTDMLFMGWVSTEAQGGVGLGAVLSWTCASFFVGTLTVINTFVAQHLGAGHPERCGGLVWQGLAIALGFSVLLEAAAFQVQGLVDLFGAPPPVAAIAGSYTRIRVAGLPLVLLETCITSFLRGIGDTRTPMKVSFATVLLNIPLNAWLIFGGLGVPALGASGAAYATVASQGVGLLVLLGLFLGRDLRQQFHTGPMRPVVGDLARLLKVGLPIGVGWVLEMATWSIFSAFVSRFGPVPLAAHNIVMQVIHLSFMPGVALSVAATTLVGQHIGARDPAGAVRSGYAALKMGMAYMSFMGLLFLVFGGTVTLAFNRDPAVVSIARRIFVVAAAFQVFDAMGMVCGGILRGAGDTRFPMVAAVAYSWLVFVPCIWLFGAHLGWGVVGSWAGATLYIVALGVTLLLRVISGRWKSYSVVEPAAVETRAQT
jgi:MATE family multidrug resistance protein